jgi:hypothetical protein
LPNRHTWRHPLLAASTARTSTFAMELLVSAGSDQYIFWGNNCITWR